MCVCWFLPALQIVEFDLSSMVSRRGDVDHTRAGTALPRVPQDVQEQQGQQEVSKVVDPKVLLKTLFCTALRYEHDCSYTHTHTTKGLINRISAKQCTDLAWLIHSPLLTRMCSGRSRALKVSTNRRTDCSEARSSTSNSTGNTHTQGLLNYRCITIPILQYH